MMPGTKSNAIEFVLKKILNWNVKCLVFAYAMVIGLRLERVNGS